MDSVQFQYSYRGRIGKVTFTNQFLKGFCVKKGKTY